MRTTNQSTATVTERKLRWKRRHGVKLSTEELQTFKVLKRARQ